MCPQQYTLEKRFGFGGSFRHWESSNKRHSLCPFEWIWTGWRHQSIWWSCVEGCVGASQGEGPEYFEELRREVILGGKGQSVPDLPERLKRGPRVFPSSSGSAASSSGVGSGDIPSSVSSVSTAVAGSSRAAIRITGSNPLLKPRERKKTYNDIQSVISKFLIARSCKTATASQGRTTNPWQKTGGYQLGSSSSFGYVSTLCTESCESFWWHLSERDSGRAEVRAPVACRNCTDSPFTLSSGRYSRKRDWACIQSNWIVQNFD